MPDTEGMWTREHTIKTDPTHKNVIWERWVNPTCWPQDDPDTKSATFNGTVKLGATGIVTPRSGPKSKVTVTKFEPGKAFNLETRLPLALMSFEHDMHENNGELQVTHRLQFSGPLAPIFGALIGAKIARGFPQVMQNIISRRTR